VIHVVGTSSVGEDTLPGFASRGQNRPSGNHLGLILPFILLFSEVNRMTKPEEKCHGHNVQNPPVSCKPLELIHG